MVSSLWESKLLSLSRSLSLSLRESCSWCISLSFSSMAANFSSSACCERAQRRMWEPNHGCCSKKITQNEKAYLQSLLLLFQPLSQLGNHTVVPPWAFALFKVSDHVYVLLMEFEKKKKVANLFVCTYLMEYFVNDKKKILQTGAIYIWSWVHVFVTCSCCSLSARVDVSRWIVTSWLCSFRLVWSSSSWYCCCNALSLSPISSLIFLSWLFKSWRVKCQTKASRDDLKRLLTIRTFYWKLFIGQPAVIHSKPCLPSSSAVVGPPAPPPAGP